MKLLALALLAPLCLMAQDHELRNSAASGLSCNVCHLPRVAGKGQAKSGSNVCLSCHDGVLAKLFDSSFEGHQQRDANVNLAEKAEEPAAPKKEPRIVKILSGSRTVDEDQDKCFSCHDVHALHKVGLQRKKHPSTMAKNATGESCKKCHHEM